MKNAMTFAQYTAHLAALNGEREKAIVYRDEATPEAGSPYNCEEWIIRHKVVVAIGCAINDLRREYYEFDDDDSEGYYGSDRYFEDGYEAGVSVLLA